MNIKDEITNLSTDSESYSPNMYDNISYQEDETIKSYIKDIIQNCNSEEEAYVKIRNFVNNSIINPIDIESDYDIIFLEKNIHEPLYQIKELIINQLSKRTGFPNIRSSPRYRRCSINFNTKTKNRWCNHCYDTPGFSACGCKKGCRYV